jgi:hypothetical protein
MKCWRIPTGTLATVHGGQALINYSAIENTIFCFEPLCNHDFFFFQKCEVPDSLSSNDNGTSCAMCKCTFNWQTLAQ